MTKSKDKLRRPAGDNHLPWKEKNLLLSGKTQQAVELLPFTCLADLTSFIRWLGLTKVFR